MILLKIRELSKTVRGNVRRTGRGGRRAAAPIGAFLRTEGRCGMTVGSCRQDRNSSKRGFENALQRHLQNILCRGMLCDQRSSFYEYSGDFRAQPAHVATRPRLFARRIGGPRQHSSNLCQRTGAMPIQRDHRYGCQSGKGSWRRRRRPSEVRP